MTGLLVLLMLSATCLAHGASTRVPPPGIAIAEKDRAKLRASADALALEINSMHSSKLRELRPDVQILHKAVDWALRYDEFDRSNEVGLARSLLKQGMERAKQLGAGTPSWLTATGLVVRGYISKIDGSVQPYGLVVPATFAADPNKARRLDIWLHGRDNNLTELKFISDRQRSDGEFTPADTFVLHPYGRYCNAFKFVGEVDGFEAMEHVKKSYRIDDRRIALRGFSAWGDRDVEGCIDNLTRSSVTRLASRLGRNMAASGVSVGDWRTPRPGGLISGPVIREASWSAVVLYRFHPPRQNLLKNILHRVA